MDVALGGRGKLDMPPVATRTRFGPAWLLCCAAAFVSNGVDVPAGRKQVAPARRRLTISGS